MVQQPIILPFSAKVSQIETLPRYDNYIQAIDALRNDLIRGFFVVYGSRTTPANNVAVAQIQQVGINKIQIMSIIRSTTTISKDMFLLTCKEVMAAYTNIRSNDLPESESFGFYTYAF